MPRKNVAYADVFDAERGGVVADRRGGEKRRQQRAEGVHLQRHLRGSRGVGEPRREHRSRRASSLYSFGDSRSSAQMPAVMAIGLPESVPAW